MNGDKLIKIKTILDINKNGIKFIDEENAFHFLNFEECSENWKKDVISSGQFKAKSLEQLKDSKCVGITSGGVSFFYIEFYSIPKTRIEFKKVFLSKKSHREYLALKDKIYKAGWTTFDSD